MKILIIQTAFIGDALLSIPLLKNLKEKYPDADVTYLCRAGMGDFLSRIGLVKHVLEIDKQNSKNAKKVSAQLQKESWDWIICPHESIRSQLLSRSLTASRKTSYKNLLNRFTFNERIDRPMDLPEALRTLALLENSVPEIKTALEEFRSRPDQISEINFSMPREMMREFGLKVQTHQAIIRKFKKIPKELSMQIEYFSELRSRRKTPKILIAAELVKNILQKANQRKILVIAPGSVWETKIWRRAYYRKICEELTQKNFVILIGGAAERGFCAGLAEGLENIYNAAGETSLWESAELIACSDQVLTNDSGAMHLASLSSAKTLAIFGPTSLEQGYRPWNNEARTIESTIYCRPCGKHGAKKCPLGNHACMKLVFPEHVTGLLAETIDV